jgi:hypothetical protein
MVRKLINPGSGKYLSRIQGVKKHRIPDLSATLGMKIQNLFKLDLFGTP